MAIYPQVRLRGKVRSGRGFSLAELKAVQLSVKQARQMGLRVDERRRSCRLENVELLKRMLQATNK